ncbi:hypothetical protein B9Z19DRAFT_1026574, partial [Tuber borchii]
YASGTVVISNKNLPAFSFSFSLPPLLLPLLLLVLPFLLHFLLLPIIVPELATRQSQSVATERGVIF